MSAEPSSLLGQVHDLVKSREKELDEVDVEARQPVQSCAINLSCRQSSVKRLNPCFAALLTSLTF